MNCQAARITSDPEGAIPAVPPSNNDLETVEIRLLLEGVFRHYGFDFRDYAFSSIRRRVRERLSAEGVDTVSRLQEKLLHDRACMERFLLALSINVTAMFRDPSAYLAFRKKAVPMLRTYPFIRIWHAGCSTGEEVYSLAVLMQEEGLYDRCRIYATDMDEPVLKKAEAGIFPLKSMQEYTQNYVRAGGQRSFSEYYTARYDNAIFSQGLKKNVTFAQHNLATDGPFNEFNVTFCRNVMIFFNETLTRRVLDLLHKSLAMFGYLVLGTKESLTLSPLQDCYQEVERRQRIYRRIR